MTSVSLTAAGQSLELREGTVTLDEAWAPYGQVSVTCPMPSLAALAAINPRSGVRASLTVEGRTFDLGVRARTIDHAAGTLALQLATDEALLQDYALVATTAYAPGYTTVRAAAAYALGKIGATLTAGTADANIDPTASVWTPGQTAWDYLEAMVQAGSLRLWCDELRVWRLDASGDLASGDIVLTYDTNLTAGADTISRDAAWYDAVVIVYSWVDSAGAQRTSYETASVAGFSKVLTVTRDTPPPRNGAAARLLAWCQQGRARSVALSAVSDYTISPTQTCTVVLPNGTPYQYGAVSSVAWDLTTDEMAVATRALVDIKANTWSSTSGGTAWQSVAAGITWTTYVGV
jgi:hypothetical protein